MPNWTQNTWCITGENNLLDQVRETFVDDQFFDFNKFIPVPKELANTQSPCKITTEAEARVLNAANLARMATASEAKREYMLPIVAISEEEQQRRLDKYSAVDWFDFCNLHWGTKWIGNDLIVLRDEPGCLVIHFNTAWAAPEGIIKHLQEMGLSICGGAIYEGLDPEDSLEIIDGNFEDFFEYFRIKNEFENNGEETWSWVEIECR